jgi:hypothetical protein
MMHVATDARGNERSQTTATVFRRYLFPSTSVLTRPEPKLLSWSSQLTPKTGS